MSEKDSGMAAGNGWAVMTTQPDNKNHESSGVVSSKAPSSRIAPPVAEEMDEQDANSYDELPYPSKPFRQTHPRNLATVATLFGMRTTNIHNCRVLEIGCASGRNIIPMAAELPGSRFVGVELSAVQLESARSLASTLHLRNLELRHCNILDIDESFGQFDYIIAHGVFSWVPFPVQQHVLQLCKRNLVEQGVAYLSYNTNPGWRMRGMLRDIMLYHAGNFSDTGTKIAQSRALINFLSEAVAGQKSAYATLLKDEVELMRHWEDAYFRHDSLEEVNDPLYFHEFMSRANQAGLQYLAEVDVSTMVANNFSDKVKETLDKVGNDIIQREQYMDFIRNRMFRQTLLCHQECTLTREIKIELAQQSFFAARCRPRLPDVNVNSDDNVEFILQDNLGFSSNCRYTKAIVICLSESWPEHLSFEQLHAGVLRQLHTDSLLITGDAQMNPLRGIISARVFELYIKGLLMLSFDPPAARRKIGERPVAASVTRVQAEQQGWTTNLLHEPVAIDIVNRHLLPMLDGEHDRQMILDRMLVLLRNKTLMMQEDGVAVEDERRISEKLGEQIDSYIRNAAQNGLLMN